ncbi:curli-like amyloid fiber formation chaperone CsgH [Pseudoponticoccus marisrubri]|uniref:CsgH-like domain-containing protein n=1 Tax=Pseudoponticoccus marisrubri TaxID=1685382 RepID=A0A0W7WI75_9RHOB|nr:curli-like amyloid fiber formation chaperone CsgH [Pseudoponticoccus marisrubri]KUF10239.1 hypothetical protein AVJ23_12570 [Pseudoponticoccus marisrubri]
MSHRIPTLAGIAAVLATLGGLQLGAATEGEDLPRCALQIDTAQGMLTARAVAQSPEALSGQYDLTLTRRNAGGSIDMSQSGAFELRPGETAILNEAVLNGDPRDLKARLTLKTGGRSLRCPVLVNGTPQEEI